MPIAAVDRGKRVPVALDKKFLVCNHDFAKFSLIHSVCLVVEVPPSIDGSFYSGKVHIGIKDAV